MCSGPILDRFLIIALRSAEAAVPIWISSNFLGIGGGATAGQVAELLQVHCAAGGHNVSCRSECGEVNTSLAKFLLVLALVWGCGVVVGCILGLALGPLLRARIGKAVAEPDLKPRTGAVTPSLLRK